MINKILNRYYNRAYIYRMMLELACEFTFPPLKRDKIVHFDIKYDKKHDEYTLKFKNNDDLWQLLDWSKGYDGLFKILNFKQRLEENITKIEIECFWKENKEDN